MKIQTSVYLDEKLLEKWKIRLVKEGMTQTSWFEEVVEEYLKRPADYVKDKEIW